MYVEVTRQMELMNDERVAKWMYESGVDERGWTLKQAIMTV